MDRDLACVGLVGAGSVGASWAIVFARAGIKVRLFDVNEDCRNSALGRITTSLTDMKSFGLVDDPHEIVSRIEVVSTLREAVEDVDYVQESVFERVDVKQAICAEIGPLIRDGAIVGSSSSGIPASAFTEHVSRRSRFLIVHPVNPPHLIPLVELVPAPWTDPEILPRVRALMETVGQAPMVANHEVPGFILNRLQGALLNEAWALYDEGLASIEDIDRTVSHGLGYRWSFMGPFETIDLNAPGGVDDYAQRLGPLYHSIAESRREPKPWSPDLIARVAAERRAALPKASLGARAEWRDRRLMAFASHMQGHSDS